MHTSRLIKLYTLDTGSLLYINDTSISYLKNFGNAFKNFGFYSKAMETVNNFLRSCGDNQICIFHHSGHIKSVALNREGDNLDWD